MGSAKTNEPEGPLPAKFAKAWLSPTSNCLGPPVSKAQGSPKTQKCGGKNNTQHKLLSLCCFQLQNFITFAAVLLIFWHSIRDTGTDYFAQRLPLSRDSAVCRLARNLLPIFPPWTTPPEALYRKHLQQGCFDAVSTNCEYRNNL